MSYYKLLGLEKEPFSTSPDPGFFYLSREHEASLTNILIELRLKRGLSVILGDIGTGKTTLSRKLIYELRQREDFLFYMMLNPSYETEELFLRALINQFEIPINSSEELTSAAHLMDKVERFLLKKAVQEGKTITLIIDEAQKVTEQTLEAIRILLNFETNEFKLLQVVLLGQLELVPKILKLQNFYDRISFKYVLNPLDYTDTRKLISFRIKRAGYKGSQSLFNDEAIDEIQRVTRGYPRRITMLCHKALKEFIIRKKEVVDRELVRSLAYREGDALGKTVLPQKVVG